jgi:hypothetical protein
MNPSLDSKVLSRVEMLVLESSGTGLGAFREWDDFGRPGLAASNAPRERFRTPNEQPWRLRAKAFT